MRVLFAPSLNPMKAVVTYAVLASAVFSLAIGPPGFAADLGTPPSRAAMQPAIAPVVPGWVFSTNFYVWATGLEGNLRTLPPLPTVHANLSFGDTLGHLDGALMGGIEARNDRWVVFTDLVLSKISASENTTVLGLPVSASFKSTNAIGLLSGGYRVVDTPQFTLDGLAGVRGFEMNNRIGISAGPLSGAYEKGAGWVDGVVGAKARLNLTDQLYATTIGFVGGGSSKYEWDLYGGLGYTFTDHWSAFAGYRALKVDYQRGNFLYDAMQQGPVMGASYRF